MLHVLLAVLLGFSLPLGMASAAAASEPFTTTLVAEGEFEVGVPSPEFTFRFEVKTASKNHLTSFVLEPTSDFGDLRATWVLDRDKLIEQGCTDISTGAPDLGDPTNRANFPDLFSTPDKCGLSVTLKGKSYFPAGKLGDGNPATPNDSEYDGSGAVDVRNDLVRAFIGAGNKIHVVFLQVLEDPSTIEFTVAKGVYSPVGGPNPNIRILVLGMQVGTPVLKVPITIIRYLPLGGGSYFFQSVPTDLVWPGTVTFDPAGGSGTMADFSAKGTVNLPLNTFTRAGFRFAGWALSLEQAQNRNVTYLDKALFTSAGDMTLYAVWVPADQNTASSSDQQNSGGERTAKPSGEATVPPAIHLDLSHSLGLGLSQATVLIEGEGLGSKTPYSLELNQTRSTLADGITSRFGAFSEYVGFPTDLSAGRYSVTLSSLDSAGNVLTLTQWFQVDASGVIVSVDGVHPVGLAQTGVTEALHLAILLGTIVGALGFVLVSWSKVPAVMRSRED